VLTKTARGRYRRGRVVIIIKNFPKTLCTDPVELLRQARFFAIRGPLVDGTGGRNLIELLEDDLEAFGGLGGIVLAQGLFKGPDGLLDTLLAPPIAGVMTLVLTNAFLC